METSHTAIAKRFVPRRRAELIAKCANARHAAFAHLPAHPFLKTTLPIRSASPGVQLSTTETIAPAANVRLATFAKWDLRAHPPWPTMFLTRHVRLSAQLNLLIHIAQCASVSHVDSARPRTSRARLSVSLPAILVLKTTPIPKCARTFATHAISKRTACYANAGDAISVLVHHHTSTTPPSRCASHGATKTSTTLTAIGVHAKGAGSVGLEGSRARASSSQAIPIMRSARRFVLQTLPMYTGMPATTGIWCSDETLKACTRRSARLLRIPLTYILPLCPIAAPTASARSAASASNPPRQPPA